MFQLNQKPLTVSLDARWNHTPLHLEAAEFFAEDGADSFWKFVTDLQTLDLESFIKGTLLLFRGNNSYEPI